MRRVSVLLVIAIAGFTALLGARHFANVPMDPKNVAPVDVSVARGAGTKVIARRLAEAGLLRSRAGFLLRVVLQGERGKLKAGRYRFTRAESGAEILRRLVAGDALPEDVAVTIPEGLTLQEIAARFAASGIAEADAFRAAARVENFRNDFPFLRDVPDGALEGYLFPETYRFFPVTDPSVVIRRMLGEFEQQFKAAANDAGGLHGRVAHDVVTMASIVEREVRSAEDRRLVAGILWSRLRQGIALQADATVRYALDSWDRPLTARDLQVDSPYNTRRYRGLPPGPISVPGAESLRAAFNPKESDYFYYLSAPDGKTIFSKTLKEHETAVQKYLRPESHS